MRLAFWDCSLEDPISICRLTFNLEADYSLEVQIPAWRLRLQPGGPDCNMEAQIPGGTRCSLDAQIPEGTVGGLPPGRSSGGLRHPSFAPH